MSERAASWAWLAYLAYVKNIILKGPKNAVVQNILLVMVRIHIEQARSLPRRLFAAYSVGMSVARSVHRHRRGLRRPDPGDHDRLGLDTPFHPRFVRRDAQLGTPIAPTPMALGTVPGAGALGLLIPPTNDPLLIGLELWAVAALLHATPENA